MSNNRPYDPFDSLSKITSQLEKQMNDLIYQVTDNKEFVRLLKRGSLSQTLLQERLSKNQELLASQLNIPTKNDLANVAKISIQTEEKLDGLEEQLWNLSDSADKTNQEIVTIVEISKEVMKVTTHLKSELSELKKEKAVLSEFKKEYMELKEEMNTMKELLKSFITSEENNLTEIKKQKSKQLEPAKAGNKK
ncbi:polyhydroxyalkanoate biosynthesis repressor PhaR [Neobacillus sp. MER 74]|uniref:polyhydroxyalkanoate biosynthesis repressor PhaR n=1 Tax=Neobacillus sp. MER 74 TaxID=2939566 RepID=UPI00203F4BD0|nr:polyhydroxyalkanoate biosynthesis repressor PhaR [Neobacillus sp. MER 74]MCM3113730.1 polyhydroxyalkanoate biosynthesis repressor PhaR [Neobacillus sp. MER 74]